MNMDLDSVLGDPGDPGERPGDAAATPGIVRRADAARGFHAAAAGEPA